jgi:hypothetical protein
VRPERNSPSSAREFQILVLILVVGLIHGLVYVVLLPPWQHYDEPNHFEYLWLAANLGRLPVPGDSDPQLGRSVLASMIENGFYDQSGGEPELGPAEQAIKIPGYSQLAEPPLYYLIASLPLRWMRLAAIEQQLMAARLVSLLFYLLTLWAAWGVARELTPMGHPLRWMLPLTIALLPGFTELMTAANSDVGAVLIFSLYTWGSVRLVRRGLSVLGLAWVCGTAGLTYFVKNTAMVAILLLPAVLLFSALRGGWRWLAWGALGLAGLAGMLLSFGWGEAAYWYRSTTQAGRVRVVDSKAAHGRYVFRLETQAAVTPSWLVPLFQPLPTQAGRAVSGQVVTLGFWVWATQPMTIASPGLGLPDQMFSEEVQVGTEPAFHAFRVQLPGGTGRMWVRLSYRFPANTIASVYYDGLVLAGGERPLGEPPNFTASDGSRGEWGGQPFDNLLRNGSAEIAGPNFNPLLDRLGARLLPDNTSPSLILTSVLDWPAAGFLYRVSAWRLFCTFWAWFGWGHVPLLVSQLYPLLLAATLAGLLAGLVAIVRRAKSMPWEILAVLGMALLLVWGASLTRSPAYLAISHLFIPVARHAYPAIIPTVLLLTAGWLEIMFWLDALWKRLARRPKDILPILLTLYVFLFLLLDVLSILSIARFYGKL